jgi:hypothetical protein
VSHWGLALLLVAAGAPGEPPRDAPAALEACIQQLDSGLDIGYARIAERCPDLAPTLLRSPWAAWLPADWNRPGNQLSSRGLSELRDLLSRESVPAPTGGHQLQIERVAAVLQRIARAEPAPQGRWARFKHWLRGLFTPQQPNETAGWWRRLFGEARLEEGALRAIVWSSLALVIALAVAVVVNELRVAGLLRPRGAQVRPGSVDGFSRDAMTLEEIGRANPAEQPAMLLESIAARLAEQQRLPPARALTVRELTRQARLPHESDRSRLAELAAVCERVRFSAHDITPLVMAEAIARGREVLSALETAALSPGAA